MHKFPDDSLDLGCVCWIHIEDNKPCASARAWTAPAAGNRKGLTCAQSSASHPQDFEALTPNLLARTIETVEGGGIVVMLLSTLRSLRELFSLTMDVHSRLRTESHQQVTGVPLTPDKG